MAMGELIVRPIELAYSRYLLTLKSRQRVRPADDAEISLWSICSWTGYAFDYGDMVKGFMQRVTNGL
jgi:hypothetical protein